MAATVHGDNGGNERVAGVILAKADRALVLAALARVGVVTSAEASISSLVAQLASYFKKNCNRDHLGRCEIKKGGCGGHSPYEGPIKFDDCPYCGLGDEEPSVIEATAVPVDEVSEDDGRPGVRDDGDDEQEETDMQDEGEHGEVAQSKSNGKAAHDPAVEEVRERRKVRPAPAAPAAKDAPTAAIERAASAKKTEPAVVSKAGPLDAHVARIIELKGEAGKNMYAIGKELDAVFRADLWKQRKDDKGHIVHKGGFDAWAAAEVNMSKGSARTLIDIARKWDEKFVSVLGYTKCALLLRAPPEDEVEIIEKAIKTNATKREIVDMITTARSKRGLKGKPLRQTGRSTRTAKATEAAGKSKSKKRAKEVTAVLLLKHNKVDLYTQESRRAKEPRPAKKIGERPWGTLELENITLHFAIVSDDKGHLRLIVDGRRSGDD